MRFEFFLNDLPHTFPAVQTAHHSGAACAGRSHTPIPQPAQARGVCEAGSRPRLLRGLARLALPIPHVVLAQPPAGRLLALEAHAGRQLAPLATRVARDPVGLVLRHLVRVRARVRVRVRGSVMVRVRAKVRVRVRV